MSAQAVLTERIRGPGLAVLARYNAGVPLEEGLRRANERNLVVASNKRLDRALVSDEWNGLNVRPALPAWSGTMTGYEEAGKKLGATIEYVDQETGLKYVFPVPKEYRGKKDVILVAEHPDYELRLDGNNRVVDATKVDLVSNLPTANEWYLTDPVHGIPTGENVSSSDPNTRYLYRIAKRVGLLVRLHFGGRQLVGAVYRASYRFGVAVEAAEGSTPHECVTPAELNLTRESPAD